MTGSQTRSSAPTRPIPAGARPYAVDASMDLLNQIIRQPVDPDYARVAQQERARPGNDRRSHHWIMGGVAVVVGAMFALGAVQTTRSAPVLATERTELIDRVQAAEAEQDQLQSRVDGLNAQISTLRGAALGDDGYAESLKGRITALEPVAGTVAVSGPGLTILVDDAPSASADARDRVLDLDLQVLANGLWSAGAEAVAINGQRLTALSAIRAAGDAVLVDFRPLTPPYVVEAVGDPHVLRPAFVGGFGGSYLQVLKGYGIASTVRDDDRLDLPASVGVSLRYAAPPAEPGTGSKDTSTPGDGSTSRSGDQ